MTQDAEHEAAREVLAWLMHATEMVLNRAVPFVADGGEIAMALVLRGQRPGEKSYWHHVRTFGDPEDYRDFLLAALKETGQWSGSMHRSWVDRARQPDDVPLPGGGRALFWHTDPLPHDAEHQQWPRPIPRPDGRDRYPWSDDTSPPG